MAQMAQTTGGTAGAGLIFGSIIGAGVISILIAPAVSRMLRFFPPVVTGTIIAVIGISLDAATLKKAAAAAEAIMSPAADARGPVEYRRHVGGIMVARALQRAAQRAG